MTPKHWEPAVDYDSEEDVAYVDIEPYMAAGDTTLTDFLSLLALAASALGGGDTNAMRITMYPMLCLERDCTPEETHMLAYKGKN